MDMLYDQYISIRFFVFYRHDQPITAPDYRYVATREFRRRKLSNNSNSCITPIELLENVLFHVDHADS